MREFCLKEDVLQQFVDGELSSAQTEAAATHLAACATCASLLREVEQENALLMEALAPEMSLSIPTARLRERLDAAIAELEPQKASNQSAGLRLRAWLASLFGPLSFTPQHALGFASLIVIVAFASIFAVIQLRRGDDAGTRVAVNTGGQLEVQTPSAPAVRGEGETQGSQSSAPETAQNSVPGTKVSYKPEQRRAVAKRPAKASGVSQPDTVTPQPAPTRPAELEAKLLPGEKGYLEAIASLTSAIESNKEDVLKPTVLADYERNLAVVNQAIVTTRQQAKRNPQDRDAVEFMYMAYQNKIELLSAVADQARVPSR